MRSDELVDRLRESAVLGTAASWPDWPDTRLLNELTDRHLALQTEEIITAQAGYGLTEYTTTCVAGTPLYPIPDRAAAGTIIKLELQVPGNTTWYPLTKLDITEAQNYDIGPTKPGQPNYYSIQDGWVELYQTPSAAFSLKFTFYIRPSQIVLSQSSVDGGEGVARGRITSVNKVSRLINATLSPLNRITGATIQSGIDLVDVIHAAGNFNLAMWSQPQTNFVGGGILSMTFTGTDDMSRVQVGDWVRVAEQSDWPINLPPEWHRMLADRAAMEVARSTGRGDLAAQIAPTVQADLERFRVSIRPQAKNAPKTLPLSPYYARGRSRTWVLP